jgi:hypothetical protein
LHRLEINAITTKSGEAAQEAEGEHVTLLMPYPSANLKCRVEFNVGDPEDLDLVVIGSDFEVAETTLAKFNPDDVNSLFEVIEDLRDLYKQQKIAEAEAEPSVTAANAELRALVEMSIVSHFEVCATSHVYSEYAVKIPFSVAEDDFDPPELEPAIGDASLSVVVRFILSSSGSLTFRTVTPTKSLARRCGPALKTISIPLRCSVQDAFLSLHQDISSMLDNASSSFVARRRFTAHLSEEFGDSLSHVDYLRYNSVTIEVGRDTALCGFVELRLDAYPKVIEVCSLIKDETIFLQEPTRHLTPSKAQLNDCAAYIRTVIVPNISQDFYAKN